MKELPEGWEWKSSIHAERRDGKVVMLGYDGLWHSGEMPVQPTPLEAMAALDREYPMEPKP